MDERSFRAVIALASMIAALALGYFAAIVR